MQPGVTAPAAVTATAGPPGDSVHSLSFGYVPSWFQLPADAQDKFMQVQNVTLAQLPQLPGSAGGAGSQGRALRDLPGVSTPQAYGPSCCGHGKGAVWPCNVAAGLAAGLFVHNALHLWMHLSACSLSPSEQQFSVLVFHLSAAQSALLMQSSAVC
jgi:hypothetical protein